jgi:hypothetical protein
MRTKTRTRICHRCRTSEFVIAAELPRIKEACAGRRTPCVTAAAWGPGSGSVSNRRARIDAEFNRRIDSNHGSQDIAFVFQKNNAGRVLPRCRRIFGNCLSAGSRCTHVRLAEFTDIQASRWQLRRQHEHR